MDEYWVDIRFTVEAQDKGDAARKLHDWLPDVELGSDVKMWHLEGARRRIKIT